jgi:uncharacterized protein (TIGR01244 family)
MVIVIVGGVRLAGTHMIGKRAATLLIGIFLASAGLLADEIPVSMDPASMPNYRLLRAGLATAGQPSPEALRRLKAMGFKTVINLRAESEKGVKDEEAIVREQQLRYVSIPVAASTFSMHDVEAVAQVLDDPHAGPILFHCGSANRVGAVWAVLQVQKGKTREEALSEGKAIGLSGAPMLEAVERVLAARPRP